jgi:hypothetical protein
MPWCSGGSPGSKPPGSYDRPALRERYDEYIRRFNAEDATAFDDFLAPDMRMQNGTPVYYGVRGMKDHYAKIWGTLNIMRAGA